MYKNYSQSDDGNVSETGNWNVASDYVKLKIMKPLVLSDEYSRIAKLGYSTMFEELGITVAVSKDELRLRGFEWLINELLLLIDNSIFAIKSTADTEELQKYYVQLKEIEKVMPLLSKKIISQVKGTNEIKIIDDKYDPMYDRVVEIKRMIEYPLNRNHLIFYDKETFNVSDYKKKLSERIRNQG
jgi:hypothetical protein